MIISKVLLIPMCKVAIRRDILFNLSQIAQLLLERLNLLVPEDGVRGIYYALLLLCQTYSNPHAYLVHSHSKFSALS